MHDYEKPVLIQTGDGSSSLYADQFGEPYHSRFGALTESRHVFLAMGWEEIAPAAPTALQVLEVGLGTGLNALLTLEAWLRSELRFSVHYHAIEAFPISETHWSALNYPEKLAWPEAREFLDRLHMAPWEQDLDWAPGFQVKKTQKKLEETHLAGPYHLVYFDAFAPESQPELWTTALFSKVRSACSPGAVLVTYCAKGAVRRALQEAGFIAERLPGPPGKREMLRGRVPLK